jgi:hypothetical protein
MIPRLATVALMVCLLAGPASADDDRGHSNCHITGTWLVDVDFPAVPGLHFKQLLTLHKGGTLTETNGGLHANSFPGPVLPPGVPAPPPLNGSDGHGSWELLRGCRVQWSFLKMVYAGVDIPLPPSEEFPAGHVIPAGSHAGYLRVRSVARIMGDQYVTVIGDTSTQLLFGPDPLAPIFVPPAIGDSVGIGYRLMPTD